MIKKLDILLIRSFVGPFIVTFFVALFVLVMQFFWLYMDEMIGKGAGVLVLMQLMVYMSTTMVPLALPLAILLSSIMTFGNMGENFELVAIKSSGISLLRFMQPLFLFILLVSVLAFLFANNVTPVANLKALSLLYDVRNAKPAWDIRPDQFNTDIQGYAIRVGSKDEDGKTIRDVMIYDHTDMVGNNKLVLAKEGKMVISDDKQSLVFMLKDGWQYQEGYENGRHDYTQVRMHFEEWNKVFDMSGLKFTRTNEEMFKNAYQMMNVAQLSESLDSLRKGMARRIVHINSYMAPYMSLETMGKQADSLEKKLTAGGHIARSYDTTFMELVPDTVRKDLLEMTSANVRNLKSLMDVTALDNRIQKENYLKYDIELQKKYALSFACLLLFLIGAPLGAIIRKGGLGMPLVIAVVFFVLFHILNITGEKLAKSATVEPWLGIWMSSIILLPLAFWLIVAARNDSRVFAKEWYIRIWRSIQSLLPAKKQQIGI